MTTETQTHSPTQTAIHKTKRPVLVTTKFTDNNPNDQLIQWQNNNTNEQIKNIYRLTNSAKLKALNTDIYIYIIIICYLTKLQSFLQNKTLMASCYTQRMKQKKWGLQLPLSNSRQKTKTKSKQTNKKQTKKPCNKSRRGRFVDAHSNYYPTVRTHNKYCAGP